ncbi:reverse transcriptase domain-containing protein [Tanacetum coccineum]|uniref:Reverse transcriptase domain-containing protein n=1 Tax=Tanacetum coccineum TaxID=301880 RepID=A0ABQ5EYE8_9ASTR
MLRNCHGHNLFKGNIIKIFYHSLNEITQEALNSAAGGIFLYKIPNQAYQLLEDKVLLKLDWAKNQKPKLSLKKVVAFADEGSSNSDTDKITALIDAMTLKMDVQYKEIQSRSNHSIPEYDEDDKPMSPEAEAKFMQTFRYMFMDLKTKLKTTTKNHQASIQYLEAYQPPQARNEQSGRPSGSLPSNTHPDPKGMPNYGKFLKEPVSNKHKLEQIASAFLSDESSTVIQNKVPPKVGDPENFLIPCTFSKAFSCDALADLGASINIMPYSLYAKLSLESLKLTKMSVKEGIFLGHKVSGAGLEVNKAKINVIPKLPPATNVKGIRSFLGHANFYRRFIKDFSKIVRPLTKLLEKDTSFEFNDECHKAFNSLKENLTCTPVIVSPNWNLPFDLMCDASEFAVGAVLGQKDGKHFHPIYFASKTLNATQQKYTVTEKELMAVVFAFDKFRPYQILSKTIFYIDHSTLRYLFKKQDAKPGLIC